MAITDGILQEFKDRMHLSDYEDDNLKRILSACEKTLKKSCGNFMIDEDEDFKELVFERARYVYNDALEFFENNFIHEINRLAISKALDSEVLEDESAL